MGNVSHKRFLLIRSVSPGAFVKNRQHSTQVGHINYAGCNNINEVQFTIAHDNYKLFRPISILFTQKTNRIRIR